MSSERYDLIVSGPGAVGLALAIGAARTGRRVCLLGPETRGADGRTAALLRPSLDLLDRIGLGPAVATASAPLRRLRIVDATGSLFAPPPAEFDAAEIGLPFFGRNIENAALLGILAGAAREQAGLTWRPALAEGLADADLRTVRLADGSHVTGAVVAAADGRFSSLRKAAGIAVRDRRLPQAALTAILSHDRPHGDASTEFHRRGGPCTLVPLPGGRSSLVWVDTAEATAERAALDDAALGRAVTRVTGSLVGACRIDGPRGTVPLGLLSVDRLTEGRLVLLGEAAHALPPIGAQGLNLGLADAAALLDETAGRDLADDNAVRTALARFVRSREADIRLRSLAVEGLNASLLRRVVGLDALRGVGLGLVASIGPLRRAVMKAGLGAGPPLRASRTTR